MVALWDYQMNSGNPMSWLEKRSDVRGKSETLDGTILCIDLLFQKGSVKQIHPKGIDVDSGDRANRIKRRSGL